MFLSKINRQKMEAAWKEICHILQEWEDIRKIHICRLHSGVIVIAGCNYVALQPFRGKDTTIVKFTNEKLAKSAFAKTIETLEIRDIQSARRDLIGFPGGLPYAEVISRL